MAQMNIREAENQFFQLIEQVRGGKEIFITEQDRVPLIF
jgi:antitoxin (DNA-binding transcriptional repressor) of toxin-antitoxin stability system